MSIMYDKWLLLFGLILINGTMSVYHKFAYARPTLASMSQPLQPCTFESLLRKYSPSISKPVHSRIVLAKHNSEAQSEVGSNSENYNNNVVPLINLKKKIKLSMKSSKEEDREMRDDTDKENIRINGKDDHGDFDSPKETTINIFR